MRGRWHFIVGSIIALLMVIAAILSPPPHPQELFPNISGQPTTEVVTAARKDVGDVIVTLEDQLLTVLGLQLGIVAFAATMIFGKDFAPQSPKELFWILVFLTILLAIVYLHLYKTYLGAYAYAVLLEAKLPEGLRTFLQIFRYVDEPNAPAILRPLISLTQTFYIISFLPVYVVLVTAVGFGRKLGIRQSTIWAVCVLSVAWAVTYLLPMFRVIIQVGG